MKKNISLILLLIISGALRAYISDIDLYQTVRSIMVADEAKEQSSKVTVDEESEQKDQFICVSLGSNCFTAIHLDKNKLRRWSFPFDWNVTSFYGLCGLIKNNFEDFFNPEYLCIRQNVPGVYNNKYCTVIAHDFPTIHKSDGIEYIVDNYKDYIGEILTKYQRRIKRFYNVCHLADTVYFFRIKVSWWTFDTEPNNKQNAIKLRDILRKTFPTNNWVLVVVDTSAEFAHDWGIPQIKNFRINDLRSDDGWREIYRNLGLLN